MNLKSHHGMDLKSVLLSLTLTVCSAARTDYEPCPPAQLLLPCNCTLSPLFPIVECGNIDSVDTLEEVFERSGDRDFVSFALYNATILYLPSKAVSQKGFWQLMIVNATMSALFDAQPDPRNRLAMIMVRDSRMERGIGWELFGSLKELRSITIVDTEVRHLDKSFADNVHPGLTHLQMTKTRTRKLQYNVFARLTELSGLEVVDNEIRSLSRSLFATPAKLGKLDFSKNFITSIPNDLFSNMPGLAEVILQHNQISVLSEDNFGRFYDQFAQTHMEGNPIRCDCTFKWYVTKARTTMYATCGSPDDMRGKNVQDLVPDDFRYCRP